jgi:hypothetical protein
LCVCVDLPTTIAGPMPSRAKCANPLFPSVSALARIRSGFNVARFTFQPCNNAPQQCPDIPDSIIHAKPRHTPCVFPGIPSRQQTCQEKSDVKQAPCRLFSALQASTMPCHSLARSLPYCTLERVPASWPLARSLLRAAPLSARRRRAHTRVTVPCLQWPREGA